mgnify:CR=1 FL=1
MIRLSKMTDYAIVLMGYISRHPENEMCNSRGLAEESQLPLPTVSKILKALSRSGLLVSHRGNKGGYTLVRRASELSIAEIITAMEGGLALTECTSTAPVLCELEPSCPVRSNWTKINKAVCDALAGLTLDEMAAPLPKTSSFGLNDQTLLKLVKR